MTQVSQGSTNTGGASGSGSLFSFDNIYGTVTTYIQTEFQTMADSINNANFSGEIAGGFDSLGAAPSIIEGSVNAI